MPRLPAGPVRALLTLSLVCLTAAPSHGQARVTELEKHKDEAVEVARSLSDPTRLRILKLIAEHSWHWHGKKIAEKLDLSPSTVSRQLTQLRDSGLLIEERHDDQTVTYRLVEDAIKTLPEKITVAS